jgi:hypothetical protein
MRKAFVGLSSPLAYNYDFNFEKLKGRPNPILDSPMGLFLFYDEIWFANRRTCPYNCEDLAYTHFLDEEYDLSKMELGRFSWSNPDVIKSLPEGKNSIKWDHWKHGLELNLGNELPVVDNHGRSFLFGGLHTFPNPDPKNLLVDDFLASEFGMELITNTVTAPLSALTTASGTGHLETALTQLLICENIPNCQWKEGPYLPFIDDLRSENTIKKFRLKISEVTANKSPGDLIGLKTSLEKSMDRYLNELIIKQVDSQRIFKSIFNAIISWIPVLSDIYGRLDGGKQVLESIRNRKENGWMGFIAKSRLKMD